MGNNGRKKKNAAVSTSLALVIIIIIAAIAGGSIYYYYYTTTIPVQQTIKIGLVTPTSLPEGEDMNRAATMAVNEINTAGGIYVRDLNKTLTIELIIIDTKNADPDVGTTAVTRAITQDKVGFLIGGYSSRETMATEVVAIDNKIPFIITGASTKNVTVRPGFDTSYMFHYCTTTDQYARAIVHFFDETVKPLVSPDRNLKLAVLYRDDAFGKGVLGSAKKFIADDNLSIAIIAEEKFSPGANDFKTQLGKIKAAKIDALLTAGFIPETVEIYTQGIQDVDLDTIYIACENNESPEFYKNLLEWGDRQLLQSKFGSYAGPPFYLPFIGDYVSKYNATYGVIPGMMGADTYDAFYILKDSIERAGTLNRTLIRDAIESVNMTQRLIVMDNGRIQFSTEPATYHEIFATVFIEQLFWNATLEECRPKIIYPCTPIPGVGYINQTNFELPIDYISGGP